MSVDAHGLIWLSDPTTAAAIMLAATGLLLWCHRRLVSDGTRTPSFIRVRADEALASRTPATSVQGHDDAPHQRIA